ncbi:uncharacterized protein [Atheta coriaria]
MQWQVKLSTHLGDGPQFLVLLSSAPTKARIQAGPAKLHVQEKGFCLSVGVPPRLVGHWLMSNLRRYGVVEGRFCFEGGSRCGKGEGLHVLVTDQGEEISSTLKLAATGQLLASRRRPVSRNMSVMDSPRRPLLRSEMRNPDITDASLLSRVDSPFTDLDSNYGCGDVGSTDGWNGPPIERCMSCISKLGAMSRSSTATITPGVPTCWEHTCDRHSISSGSDSSGWSQTVTRPPARPPKPTNGATSPLKAAPPLPPTTYDNYDIPNFPYPVQENKTDEHYDTPRKIKECLADAVRKPCGCVYKVQAPAPEIDRERERSSCYCQRFLSCWGQQDDINALYAQVDLSKKCNRNANYANLAPMASSTPNSNAPASNGQSSAHNYANMEFAQSLQHYENAKQVLAKARMCTRCGHAQDDYLLMHPGHQQQQQQQAHPGYLPMLPPVKQRLGKMLSNSNPNLTKPGGAALMQSQSNIYQRKQVLDSTDNLLERRKRSNSADSSSRTEEGDAGGEPSTTPNCICSPTVRRASLVPTKANRDSSSSNDSGVFELPRKMSAPPSTLPRRSKSSDPLKDISFNFQKGEAKSASAEAEVPLCPTGSTSSGTSDMSDYFETLSLSSHSSSDAPPPSCTLRPRSGNEYLSLQRLITPVQEERN